MNPNDDDRAPLLSPPTRSKRKQQRYVTKKTDNQFLFTIRGCYPTTSMTIVCRLLPGWLKHTITQTRFSFSLYEDLIIQFDVSISQAPWMMLKFFFTQNAPFVIDGTLDFYCCCCTHKHRAKAMEDYRCHFFFRFSSAYHHWYTFSIISHDRRAIDFYLMS